MRTPAVWPLHTARAAPSEGPAPAGAKPEAPPDSKAAAPRPFAPAQSHKAGEPLLRRPAAAAADASTSPPSSSDSPSPPSSPPSLESIIAATSVEEPADRGRWTRPGVLIAALASVGVLIPCLVGAAFMMLTPDAPPLGVPSLGATDQAASLPPPAAAISLPREHRAASGEPRASAPEPRQAARSLEPVPPPAPALAASLAAAPAASPAPEAVAEAERRIAALESDKEALTAEVRRLERDRQAPTQTNSIPSPPLATPNKQPGSGPGSPAAVEAERRIAALESEKDALAAEVSRLGRDRQAPEQAKPWSAAKPSPADKPSPAAMTSIAAAESSPEPGAVASLPEGMPARVLIRYPRSNADARRQAESLADALKRQGVEVADLRESDSAVGTGVSFFYARDAATAQRIGSLVGVAPTRRPQMRDGLMARPGAIELNFSGDSHFAAITTPRKESVHE